MLSGPDPLPLPPARDALEASAAHQELDLVAADHDAPSEGELGMDAVNAVGATRLGVDLGDQVGQHRVPDRTLGRRPLSILVEAGL